MTTKSEHRKNMRADGSDSVFSKSFLDIVSNAEVKTDATECPYKVTQFKLQHFPISRKSHREKNRSLSSAIYTVVTTANQRNAAVVRKR